MDKCLVSIIVPIYNVEKYLDRCLNSIQQQTYRKIEVILVNDGSKDLSRDIALEYHEKDNRFRLFDKENGGLSSGRNYGLNHVHGEFVTFVDSDDFIARDYIEKLLAGFDQETDIVIGDYVIYDVNKNKYYEHANMLGEMEFSSLDEKRQLLLYLLNGTYPVMPVWKNMYRVLFLNKEKLRFVSERLVYAEDLLFNLEAYYLAKKVKIIPEIIFYHQVVPGSLSQSYRSGFFDMQLERYKKIELLFTRFGEQSLMDIYNKKTPEMIGSAMLNLSKCNFAEAVNNIDKMLKNDFVIKTYEKHYGVSGKWRYCFLYQVGKLKMPMANTLIAKLMLLANPVYRFFQKKKEYIP